jgi:uncharacterized protein YbjT (DUF2867 family)
MKQRLAAVTGAFGFTGQYIAKRLLDSGQEVITLTNSPERANPFGGRIKAYPFNFDNPEELKKTLQGVSVLYNTYWVRFNHKLFRHSDAVENSIILFDAAKTAGVERIVHISITNPSEDSPLEYFRGKAVLEKAIINSGLSYAILRPAVIFGREDILINNIAWTLQHLPVFGIFGNGQYKLQPIYVEDIANLAVERGSRRDNVIINAIGPETFTYKDLVKYIAEAIGKKRPIISVPPSIGFASCRLLGKFVKDIIITREEIAGLMSNLLFVDSPPVGKTKLTDWIHEHADSLGRRYNSELARRIDKLTSYQNNY